MTISKEEILRLARNISRTMREHGYGIGEIGYYIKEAQKDWLEEGATKTQVIEAENQVYDLLETMEKTGLS